MIARAVVAALALAACGDAPAPPDADLGPWRRALPLPAARLEAAAATWRGTMVVVGGFGPGLDIETTRYQLAAGASAWTVGPPAPVAWTHAQLAAVGDQLVLAGGLAGTGFAAQGAVFVDSGAGWAPRTALPVGAERGSAAVAATTTTLYLAGGASSTAALASAWAYDVAADRWSPLPDLPGPRSHAVAAVAADGTLVVVGGLRTLDATQPLADVVALAPGAPAWIARAPMPTARGGCAAALVDGELWCAGGEAGAAALAAVEAYDLAADRWRALPPLPEPRAGTQGANLDGALRVPGGAARLAYQPEDSVFVWRP